MNTNHITGSWKGITWTPLGRDWSSPEAHEDTHDILNAGISWARISFHGDESFDSMDQKVMLAKEHNINILACYHKANPKRDLGNELQVSEQIARLKTVVDRYKDYIRYWEMENEANLNRYWNLGGEIGMGSSDPGTPYNLGVHRYVLWLKESYPAIKSVDPDLAVIMGGVSEWNMEVFLARLTLEEAYRWFDAIAVHPYANVKYGVSPDTVIMELNHLKEEMALWPAPYKDIPIWVTEIGFMTEKTWDCLAYVENEHVKAELIEQTMVALLQNLPHPTPIFLYTLHELGYDNGFGLVKKGAGKPTVYQEAYYRYKAMDNNRDAYRNARVTGAGKGGE